ncbi:hypothetical protein PoB_001065200 [Plakobranchus ocellatus]|uniref:Uncharacterized protein n=1 Tax=Plakobranchus ocellatus TaxID=259542 RepID=A0AAV3YNZ2_9GAST|nr:hypothetical protein PoB_001065200 [Plakobranchus ocellatus]
MGSARVVRTPGKLQVPHDGLRRRGTKFYRPSGETGTPRAPHHTCCACFSGELCSKHVTRLRRLTSDKRATCSYFAPKWKIEQRKPCHAAVHIDNGNLPEG